MFIPAVSTLEKFIRPVVLSDTVRLESPTGVLVRLLAQGNLHAAEFRCLDYPSRLQVRRALLKSCLMSLTGEWP